MDFKTLSKRTWALIATATTLVVIGAYFLIGVFASFAGSDKLIVDIPRGADAEKVKTIVLQKTSAPQRMAFSLLASCTDYYDNVRPGRYDLGSGMSTLDVFRNLRNGRQEAVRLTIPLVRTLDDLTEYLGAELEPSADDFYNTLTADSTLTALGLTRETAISLFVPNTYEVYWNTTPGEFVKRMQKENDTFWTAERQKLLATIGPDFTRTDAMTLASIVEQETQYAPERPDVAGMYINRLNDNMPLQADPTVKFAVGDFTIRRVTGEHLKVESPYNTYKNRGLPPGPICVPSVSSIDAVLHYGRHNYLYMCAKEDFSGSHNFAATYSEHQANAAKYRKALDARGIK